MNKMMKTVLCALCLVLGAWGAFAATKTVTWTLPSDWEAGVEYTSLALPSNATPRLAINGPNFGYPSDPVGAPALPFIPVNIKVAEGSVYSNCTVEASWAPISTSTSNLNLDGLRPSIINEPYIVGEAPIYSPEDPQYFGAARYPATPESIGGVQTCADDTSIMAWVTPYRWNGQTGKLEKATALKLTITYDAPRAKLKLTTSSTDNYTGLFIILSPSYYINMWDDYLTYRRGTHPHIEFEVVNTADIYSNAKYTGDDALKLHKYLEERYANRGGRKMYVLLGGGAKKDNENYNNTTMIPFRMTAVRNRFYYPSDMYYACMDKCGGKEVWDYNGDGIYVGYKSGGSYVSDTRAQADITPDIVVSRLPLRPSFTHEGKTVTAQQMINGLAAKLARVEAADFSGNFVMGYSGYKIFAEKSHGNTEDWMTKERTFYDGKVNIWAANHASPIHDSEYSERDSHVNRNLANRPEKDFKIADTDGNAGNIHNSNMEAFFHASHGAPTGGVPINNTGFWKSKAVVKFAGCQIPCSTGWLEDERLTLPEALILNPDGGACASYHNSREGYGTANNFNALSMLMQREFKRALFENGNNFLEAGDAFNRSRELYRSSTGNIQWSTVGMACYVEVNAFGDPLVKLCAVPDGNVGTSVNGLFLRTGTATGNSVNVVGQSAVTTFNVPDQGAGTFTVSGQSFKAFKGVNVTNGDLVWSAPGGVGGSGVKFINRRGNLTVSATGTTYFGPNFTSVNNLLVSGYNCTLDFDKTGATRDVTQLSFIGTGSGSSAGTNYLRCREGGIFSPTMTIPVVNGTLALQTQNVGGGGAASNPNDPIFVLTNATLRVDTNPNWGAEFFNRAIWLNNSCIAANYQSVGFGANVDARPGLDIYVFGNLGSVIAGPQDFEIVGELRVHCEDGARITSTASLNKSSRSGSISKLGSGTLTLSAKNTVSGGVRVKEGRVIADNVAGLGTGEVIVESNAVLQLKSLPLTSLTRLTIKKGGKLVLPGDASTASYKIVDPLTSSLNFETGALVYNEHDENTPLTGNTSTDGCYLDTSLYLNWKGGDGNWSTSNSDNNWKTKAVDPKSFTQGDAVQFPDYGKVTNTIAVSGALAPGQMNFANPETSYRFTGTTGSIALGTLYTGGDVAFEPSLAVDGTLAVTSGKTEVRDVGATSVSVGPGATFKVNGEVASYVYINKIELNISKFHVNYYNQPAFLGGGTFVNCKGWGLGELRFYRGDEVVTLPPNTTISVYAPESITAKTMTYKTWNATVASSANGVVSSVTGDSAVKNLFDGNVSSRMGYTVTGGDSERKQYPTCKVTITLGSPIKMFTGYKLGSADDAVRNPENWTLTVWENSSGSSTQVSSKSGMSGGTANNWWPSASGSGYTLGATPSGGGSTAVSVASGGALENGGTYKAKVNFADGAKIKVGGNGTINVASGVTFGGNTTIDVSEAQKISGWREILSGANLVAADVYKFPLSSDDAVAKVENGKLYVATENIVKGPYSRQVSGTCNWNTTDWKNGDAVFPATWANVITRPTSILYLDVTNTTTMTVDCPVSVGSVYVTNTTQNAASLNLTGNRTDFLATLLDFSGFNGPITWEPSVNGASVNVSSNNVTLSNGAGGTLTVASNGFATVVGPFAEYNVDKFARVHFTKTNRGLTMSQIPASGTVSFDGMELQDGGGGFQKGDLTYRVENNQSLTLKETGSYNARTQSSFEIYGGNLTIKPNGSWWFGQNGVTSYTQTNGTVTVEATGTTVGNSGSGVVFGYTGEASFVFEMNISGGRFEVPNSILNIWNPTTISLSSNAVLKAKGAGARSGIAGTIEMGEGTIFEVGSAGLAAGSMKYNLYGGTIAAFEDTTITAPIALGGEGTFAAANNTTLTLASTLSTDGATLNIGKSGYAGTVRFAMDELPTGVTNITVSAGTWDMGELRPTNSILSRLTGKIAVELDDDELRQASTTGFEIIRLDPSVTDVDDKVQVVRADGTVVPANGIAKDGKLYLKVNWVYPLYGEVPEGGGEVEWSDLNWHDAIGMPFTAEWTSAITSAVLSNNCAEATTTTITNGLTTSLTVVNSGELHIISETMYTAMSTLDDSASTGKTTIGFTANNVTAGAETVIKKAGSGTLTLAAGKCAALWNNLTWGGTITGFSGTAKIKYVGDTTLTSLNYTSSGAGYVSYAQKVAMSELAFANSLTRFFEEGADVTVTRFVMGNQKNTTGQTFRQTGGKIVVTGTGNILDVSPTDKAPLLFSHWEHPVTYYLTGGELIATNGINGSVYFGRDGVPKLYIGGGTAKATLRTNGLINRSDTKDKTGSVIELKPNSYLEIGNKNFVLYQNAELKMSGGTFLAYENAEILSNTSKFTLTANTTSHLAATAGKTLTVSKIPTGTGTLICGDATNNGTVLLSGDYSNVTLGGTFTLKMTDAQKTAKVNTTLFKTADGFDATKVTIKNSDGTDATGTYHITSDGKFQWVPADAYVMPIVGTIAGEKAWSEIGWRDSSAEPKTVSSDYLANNGSVATFELTVENDAAITGTATAGTLTVSGPGRLSLPQNLTINTLKGDGTVVCDGFCRKYTGLNQSSWTGTYVLTGNTTCTGTDGYDFTDLGNANSVVEVSGVTGWFNGCSTCTTTPFKGMVHNYTLRIGSGGLTLNNGNSNQGYCFARLEGAGALSVGAASAGPTMRVIALDVASYTGALTVTGNAGVIIGTPSDVTGTGTISIDGVYVATFGTAKLSAVSGVTVRAGGYIDLLQTDASQTVWPITSGTITMSGGVMVNGVAISSERYEVANGTITLKASATGASMSLNIIGGAKDRAGLSISAGNYAGMVPVKGSDWNQVAQHTTTASFNENFSNLKEVLPTGTVYSGPMKATISGNNTYTAGVTANNGHAQMMYGYIDDGGTGAKIIVENIPYTKYDVYVYPGGDHTTTSQSFRPFTVIAGNKTAYCPGQTTNWGSAGATHGTVTLVRGGNSGNYVKVEDCTGSTLTVQGGTKSDSVRGGLAAIQIFNTGTRLNTLTWNGGTTSGTWDKTTTSWKNGANADVAWTEVPDGINTAKFNGDTSLTLGETVSPDVIDIASNAVTSAETGFITEAGIVVAENMQIADITSISGEMWGGYVSSDGAATPCFFTKANDNQSATVQMQKKDGELKCVKIALTQDGNNIKARAVYAKWVASSYTIGSVDFDGNSPTPNNGTVVTSDTGNGYGIKKLKLSVHNVGTLFVANAEKFGKAFTVTNGILTVTADTLTQDVTLGPSAKLNIVSTEIATEYVATKGKVINGTMENLLFNGLPLESGSWTLDLENGKLNRVVKPGTTPFTYTIAENGTTQWTNAPWVASNWFYVRPEEWVTNTVAEAWLTVNSGVTNTLVANANIALDLFKIVNSGELHIISETMCNLSATTVDDSASSGTTTLGFSPTNVKAGVDTILSQSITGKLTVGSGNKATINGVAGSYDVSSGGEVRFEGDTTRSKLVSSDGAIVSYENASFDVGSAEYWKLKLFAGDHVTVNSAAFIDPVQVSGGELVLTNKDSSACIWYGGNSENGKAHSNFSITGGRVVARTTGVGTKAAECGFLFGQTMHGNTTPSLTIYGGEFDVSGGHFTFWQKGTATVANGILKAKGIYKQDGNTSTLTVNAGGVVEIGSDGIDKNASQTLTITMNGGTLRASDTAEAKLPITLTSANTFSAAGNKTLTVSGLLSGAGSVVIGEEDWTGTVKFSITNSFTGGVTLAYGTLEVPTGALKGNVTIGVGTTLNVTGTAGGTEYAITDGTITGDIDNIRLNGKALPSEEKWEIEGGKIKRRIITPPFKFIITQNGNWNEQTWYDTNNIVLRDYEVAEYSASKPSITLEVQNESSLFITNALDLNSLAATGQKVTLDFTGYNGEELASKATFLHPSTNVFIETTSAILGNYDKTAPNLPTGYTGEFIADATGLRYVITAPRKGYDYVGTIDSPEGYDFDFDDIEWENGVAFTNNYQNTVTLKVAGEIDLNVSEALTLYKFTFAQLNEDNLGYVYLYTNDDVGFEETFANVRSFDFSGAFLVDTLQDFESRIEKMPSGYLQLSCDYEGSLKNGYSFCGTNNIISGGEFAGDRVGIYGAGTLTGSFSIAQNTVVYLGGNYNGSSATFNVGEGELNIYGANSFSAVTGAGTLVINYGGNLTANLNGYAGSLTLGDDYYSDDTGVLHLTGTMAGPVTVSSNGTLYLTRTTPGQTEFQITTGTLTFDKDHGAKLYVDGELIESSDIISIEDGTITIRSLDPPTQPFIFIIAESGEYNWSTASWVGSNESPVKASDWTNENITAEIRGEAGKTARLVADLALNLSELTIETTEKVELGRTGNNAFTVATLSVANGYAVALESGVSVASYDIQAGGSVHFLKADVVASPIVSTEGAIVSYKNANFTTAPTDHSWILRIEDGDSVTMSSAQQFFPIDVRGGTLTLGGATSVGEYIYGGKKDGGAHTNSVITVNGGKVVANINGTATSGNSNRGFIYGGTTYGITQYPTVVINSGEFDISSGVLAPWEYSVLTVNGGVLKANGICKGGGTDSTLNLNGGELIIGNLGITTRAGTFPIMVGGDVKITSTAAMPVSLPTTVNEDCTLTFNASAGDIDASAANIVNNGTIVVEAGNVNLGTARGEIELKGSTTTITLYETINDGGTLTLKSENANGVVMKRADGTTAVEVASKDNGDGTVTYTFTPQLDGKVCWWDYEFNGDVNSAGTDTTALTAEGTTPYFGNDNTALWVGHATHYRGATYLAEFTAVLQGKMVNQQKHVEIGFGSTTGGTKISVAIACGDPAKEEVELLISEGTTVKKTVLMTVPNAYTADHLYAFTCQTIDDGGVDKTQVAVYLDGEKLESFTFDSAVTLGGGFQIGSVHGGVPSGYTKATTANTNSFLNFLRVYNCVLDDKVMAAYAEEYPYVSPNGWYVREVEGGNVTWDADSQWTKYKIGEEESTTNQPAANATVELEATDNTTITMALDKDVTYEAMTIDGKDETVVTITNATDTTGQIKITGRLTINTDATIDARAIDVANTPVTIAPGKTLTIDMQHVALDELLQTTVIRLTGAVTTGVDSDVDVLTEQVQEIEGRTLKVEPNANQHYEMKVEVVPEEVKLGMAIDEGEVEFSGEKQIDIPLDWALQLTNSTAQVLEHGNVTKTTVASALNAKAVENGIKPWESYVLTLSPTDATSKPVIAPVQASETDKITFALDNVAVRSEVAGKVNVTYKVHAGTSVGGKDIGSSGPVAPSEKVKIDLPENGVRYYQIEVNIAPKQ